MLRDGQQPLMALCQAPQRSSLPAFAQIVVGAAQGDRRRAVHALDSQWRRLAYSSQVVDTSMQVCSCFEVSQSQISRNLAAGVNTIEGLGEVLKCGTNCGSCV